MKTMLLLVLVALAGCGSNGTAPVDSGSASGTGGGALQPGTGGSLGTGGSVGHGGSAGTGGVIGTGGATTIHGTGGAAGGGGTSEASDPIRILCEAECARKARCTPDKFPTAAEKTACISACVAGSPSAGTFRDGVITSVTACARDLACGANDDVCLVNAAKEQDPNWIDSPDGKACLAKHKTCSASGVPVGYADESCPLFSIFSTSTLAAFNDCLAKPCSEVEPCVGDVIPL